MSMTWRAVGLDIYRSPRHRTLMSRSQGTTRADLSSSARTMLSMKPPTIPLIGAEVKHFNLDLWSLNAFQDVACNSLQALPA